MQPTSEQISSYRERGFVKIESVVSREEALHFREVALAYTQAHPRA